MSPPKHLAARQSVRMSSVTNISSEFVLILLDRYSIYNTVLSNIEVEVALEEAFSPVAGLLLKPPLHASQLTYVNQNTTVHLCVVFVCMCVRARACVCVWVCVCVCVCVCVWCGVWYEHTREWHVTPRP